MISKLNNGQPYIMKTILNITIAMRRLRFIKCVSLIIALSVFTNRSIAQSTIHDKHEDGNYSANKFLTFGQSIEEYNNILNENISWRVISSKDKKILYQHINDIAGSDFCFQFEYLS